MSEKRTPKKYLTKDQVFSLNEKHGWFEFGDAQGDVSNAFANEAIEAYERVRAAAPELLEFVKEWLERQGSDDNYMTAKARAAILKATGEQA